MKHFYHIGIVTSDIDAAIQAYRQKHQVQFTNPATSSVTITGPDGVVEENVLLTVAYSRGGPPYIELIQAVGNGVFSEKHLGKILYYGLWEKDINKRIDQLKQQDIAVDASIHKGELPVSALITAPSVEGVRVEYVSTDLQGYIKAWTLTGKVPGEHLPSTLLAGIFSVYYFIRNLF